MRQNRLLLWNFPHISVSLVRSPSSFSFFFVETRFRCNHFWKNQNFSFLTRKRCAAIYINLIFKSIHFRFKTTTIEVSAKLFLRFKKKHFRLTNLSAAKTHELRIFLLNKTDMWFLFHTNVPFYILLLDFSRDE